MSEVRAVMFDLFETLIFPPSLRLRRVFLSRNRIDWPDEFNTEQLLAFPLAYFTHAMGIDFSTARDCQLITQYGSTEEMLYTLAQSSQKKPDAGILNNTIKLFNFWIEHCYLKHGIDQLLAWLKIQGVKLILISNLSLPWKAVLTKLDIHKYFDLQLLSFEVGYRKPDTNIFRLALDAIQVLPRHAIMIGDNYRSDIRPAMALGMKAFRVNFSHGINFSDIIEIFKYRIIPIMSVQKLNNKLRREIAHA